MYFSEQVNYEALASLPQDCSVILIFITVLTYVFKFTQQYGSDNFLLNSKSSIQSRKLSDAFLNILTYFTLSITGLWTLYNESWPLQSKYFWIGYPNHPLTLKLKYYYLLQFSYYVEQFLVLLVYHGYRKSDYVELFIHHLVTLTLLLFSYLLNFHRIGLVVLVLHDVSDVFLHIAKAFHYAKAEILKSFFFGIFAIVFFITRLVILPIVIFSIWWEPQEYHDISLYWRQIVFWKIILGTLQVLHVLWFITIFKIVIRSLKSGKLDGDARSEEDFSNDSGTNKVD